MACDRPASSKAPAYLAGLFAFFFGAIFGSGGVPSIRRNTSYSFGAGATRFDLASLFMVGV